MTAPISSWLIEPLSREVALAIDRIASSADVIRVAVMPDVHLAEDVCIGCVVATSQLIYPSAVGGDIGCGVAALRFQGAADAISTPAKAAPLLGRLYEVVPVLHHRSADAPPLPIDLDGGGGRLSDERLAHLARRDGRLELGTLGRGNHFLEFSRDEEGALWLMVHSGSRAMGRAILAHHERAAAVGQHGLVFVEAGSDAGRAYLADVGWALTYAQINRRRIADAVCCALRELYGIDADLASWLDCHHNHVRRETHDGVELWVHRKGAIPAAVGELGIIPGSMGSPSFHTEGRGVAASLSSSSHGAGRALSRSEARRRIDKREVARQLDGVLYDHRRLEALRDEAPGAYKNIGAVMRAQRALTRSVRRLDPVLNYKG